MSPATRDRGRRPGTRPVGGPGSGARPGSRAARLLAVALVLPVLELVLAVQLARFVGTAPTVLLIGAGCLAGILVLRGVGRRAAAGLRGAAASPGTPPPVPDAAAAVRVVAGVLLLVPGLLTDLAGLLLLLPPVRRWTGRVAGAALARRIAAAAARQAGRGRPVIRVDVLGVRDTPPGASSAPAPPRQLPPGS